MISPAQNISSDK